MPFTATALMTIIQPAASSVTAVMFAVSDGATSASVAVAAGTVPDSMNTAVATSTDQPTKKPSTGPKARVTQEGRPGVRVAPVQVLKGQRGTEHDQAAIQQTRRSQHPDGGNQRRGRRRNAERRRGAGHPHDDRLGQSQRPGR